MATLGDRKAACRNCLLGSDSGSRVEGQKESREPGSASRIRLLTVKRCRYSALVRTSAFGANPPTSIVECREQLKLVGLAFIMIDEERRLVRCDQLPDFFH